MESKLRIRKTQALRRGRVSIPGARYFITLCTENRKEVLCSKEVAKTLIDQLETQQSEEDFTLHCLVLMPDHLHVVFRLRERLTLGQVIGKFKSKTSRLVSWQEDFYDHFIRPDESEDEYGFYLFMNPYVDGLLGLEEQWGFWRRWRTSAYRFEELMDRDGTIPKAWVKLGADMGFADFYGGG